MSTSSACGVAVGWMFAGGEVHAEQEDGGGFQKVGKEEGGESGVVDGEEVGFGYAFGGEPVFG